MPQRYGGHLRYPQVVYIYDEALDVEVPVTGDPDEQAHYALLKVWNTTTLAWERMKQPVIELTGDLTVSMGDIEALLADNYWKRVLIDNTSGNIDYIGKHTIMATAEAIATWHVWRFQDYDGSLVRNKQGPLIGSWTGRAALGWV